VFGWRRTPAVPRARDHCRGRVRAAERRGAGAELGLVGRGGRVQTGPVEQPLFAVETVSTSGFASSRLFLARPKMCREAKCTRRDIIARGSQRKSSTGVVGEATSNVTVSL